MAGADGAFVGLGAIVAAACGVDARTVISGCLSLMPNRFFQFVFNGVCKLAKSSANSSKVSEEMILAADVNWCISSDGLLPIKSFSIRLRRCSTLITLSKSSTFLPFLGR